MSLHSGIFRVDNTHLWFAILNKNVNTSHELALHAIVRVCKKCIKEGVNVILKKIHRSRYLKSLLKNAKEDKLNNNSCYNMSRSQTADCQLKIIMIDLLIEAILTSRF